MRERERENEKENARERTDRCIPTQKKKPKNYLLLLPLQPPLPTHPATDVNSKKII